MHVSMAHYFDERNYTATSSQHGGIAGLQKTVSGLQSPQKRHIEQLEKANARLARELEIANGCLDLQKKALSMLDHLNSGGNV